MPKPVGLRMPYNSALNVGRITGLFLTAILALFVRKCKEFQSASTKWEIEMDYLHHASFGIGVLGVLVIVFGVLSGLVRFVRAEFFAARGLVMDEERKKLRHVLGYYL